MLSAVDTYRFHGSISQQDCKAESYRLCFEGSELAIIGRLFSIPFPLSLPTYKALQNQLLLPKVHQQQHQAGGFGKPQQTKCYPAFIGLFLSHILYRSGGLHFIGRDSGILEKIGKDWKGFLAFDLAVAPGKWCNFVPKNSSLWKVLLNPTLAAETKPSTAPGLNSFPQCNQHGCR